MSTSSTTTTTSAPVRRRRRRRMLLPRRIACLGIVLLLHVSINSNDAQFTNGPEDTYFCGYKWDDTNCDERQHCPSGRSEDCDGADTDGVKCFANSPCDAKLGHGANWVVGTPPKASGKSDNVTDHYWCGIGVDDAINKCKSMTSENHCPGGTSSECPDGHICFHDIYSCDARNIPTPDPPSASPMSNSPTFEEGTTGTPITMSPTMIPTDVIILPPDPLPYPSDDATDHWFCGISLEDANDQCQQHCPTAAECPMGQICFFGTECDARTHSPSPPPTRGPTEEPTTSSPTLTMEPTAGSTISNMPTVSPSLPQPSKAPTLAPTLRPTWAPMPAMVASFFCGIDWDDAITNCKRRCPTGESTECPFDEECFTGTPCEEEMGYPEEFGGANVTTASGEDGEECVPFQVSIISDNWPKEISWNVINIDMDEIIAEGTNDILVPGETVEYPQECFKSKMGCYEFTITDTGGDGICCKDGEGSYYVMFDGEIIKKGSTFYESEITPFGLCGASEPPTSTPLDDDEDEDSAGDDDDDEDDDEDDKSDISTSSGEAYRCVAEELVDRGYEVTSDKCDLFVDCYNLQIETADDWFCDDDEKCVSVPACSIEEGGNDAETEEMEEDSDSRPAIRGEAVDEEETESDKLQEPSEESPAPTVTPLEDDPIPTGPCSGEPCHQDNHCRSQYGYCGPDDSYCDDTATWTKKCPKVETESMSMSMSLSMEPTMMPTAQEEDTLIPTSQEEDTLIPTVSGTDEIPFSKPEGGTFSKPNGGKKKPPRTNPPLGIDTNIPSLLETSIAPTASLTSNTESPTSISTTAISDVSKEMSDDFWSNTYDLETSSPSYSPGNATEDGSQIDDEETEENCTSEPCPVTTHCRSRYGSCGPGFIYWYVFKLSVCRKPRFSLLYHHSFVYSFIFYFSNMYTTWKSSCPPPGPPGPPGTNPTGFPTAYETMSMQLNPPTIFAPSFAEPTLPLLAMPTLPTITNAEPFNIAGMNITTFDISDSSSTTNTTTPFSPTSSYTSTDGDYTETGTAIEIESPSETTVWETDEYLTKWIAESSSFCRSPFFFGVGFVITSLLLVIL
jgi:hypothetical protein